jgi:AcrR family transcriptional regulator
VADPVQYLYSDNLPMYSLGVTTYHHGDLRRAVLDRAVEVIATTGASTLSLRSVAADLGVSHTAPRHHFASRTGLLTAVAAEGFRMLTDRISAAYAAGGSFRDAGVAYVEFALDRRAHFSVMFAPDLLDYDDPELAAASEASFAQLRAGVDGLEPAQRPHHAAAVLASWALVHGMATLAITGNLDRSGVREALGNEDVLELTRRGTALLFGPPGRTVR